MRYLIALFLLFGVCEAATVTTVKGSIEVNNGDTVKRNIMRSGTISNLENVTFIRWNFERQEPHTQVFVNCKNLIFIGCDLTNVELQSDFIVQDCLTIHVEEYEEDKKQYRRVECGDGKVRTFEKVTTVTDTVKDDFPLFSSEAQEQIREKLEAQGIETIKTSESLELKTIGDVSNENKIKAIVVNSDDERLSILSK